MFYFVPLKFASIVQALVRPSEADGTDGPFALQFSGMNGYFVPVNPGDPQWQQILPVLMPLSPNYQTPDGNYLPPAGASPGAVVPAAASAIDNVQEGMDPDDVAVQLFEYLIEVPMNHIPLHI